MATRMKTGKFAWLLIFFGIFLSLSCIVLGNGLLAECSRQNGGDSMQKVVVSVKNQMDRQGGNSFSTDDIRKLKDALSINDIAYSVQSGLVNNYISIDAGTLHVKLTGVSYSYPQYEGLRLISGSFITEKQEEQGEMAAVIDEEAAQSLFKTQDAVGMTLEILGREFRVVGVVEKDSTVIGKLTDDGLPDVYIPAPKMLELDNTASIACLQVKMPETGIPGQNVSDVSAALQQVGKIPSNYTISDYSLKYASMAQVPEFYVFMLGIAAIFMLLKYVRDPIIKLYRVLRDGCRTDYFINVLRANRKAVSICLLQAITALAGMAAIWLGIRFKPYIPAQYIPDELINLNYYSNLIKGLIQGGIQNAGYIAPHSEMVEGAASALINMLFCISAVIGLLFLYTGYREFKKSDMGTVGLMLVFAAFFAASLLLLALAASWAGLPYMLDSKGMLVVWTFMFLYILSVTKYSDTTKRKESEISNV